jgi:type VI protein secretion system component VasK
MIILGLLLIAVSIAAAIVLAVQNNEQIQVHVLGSHVSVAAYWLAIAGLVIMAVFILGLQSWRAGAKRAWRVRSERRELARENRRLLAENQSSGPGRVRDDDPPATSLPPASSP